MKYYTEPTYSDEFYLEPGERITDTRDNGDGTAVLTVETASGFRSPYDVYYEPLALTKVARGWYATQDGRYAAVADGYEPRQHVGAHGDYEGFIAGEWAAVYDPAGRLRTEHNAGENLDWYPTKRQAVECLERHARQVQS